MKKLFQKARKKLATALPIKYGLKHVISIESPLELIACYGTSNKIRIETKNGNYV